MEGGKPLIPHASDALTNADLAHSGHLSKGSSQLQPDISDVTGTPFGFRLGDSLSSVNTTKAGIAGGTAAALFPNEAEAAENMASIQPSRWESMKRGLALGARDLLEGLGTLPDIVLNQPINAIGNWLGYDPGLRNPGAALADLTGLPEPETEMERFNSAFIRGAAGGLPMTAGGMAAASLATGPVARGTGAALATTPGTDALTGGLLNLFLESD